MTDKKYYVFDIENDDAKPGSVADNLIKDGRAYYFGEGDGNDLIYIGVSEDDPAARDLLEKAYPDSPIFDMTSPSVDEARDRYQEIMDEIEAEEDDEGDDNAADDLPASAPVTTNPKSKPGAQPTPQPNSKPVKPKAGDLRSTKARHDFVKGMKARRAAASKRAQKPAP